MSATPNINESPIDPVDEVLVAYLDGELEDDRRVELEERLMEDADCKQRLRALQQSFDMLDDLPRTSVNKDFARTTVEMVALSASQELEIVRRKRPITIGTRSVVITASCVVMFCVGVLAIRVQQHKQQLAELQALAVAENGRAYGQIKNNDDIEFFRQLSQLESWQYFTSVEGMPSGEDYTSDRLISIPVKDRLAKLEAMPPERRSELDLRFDQFKGQTEENRKTLREVAALVEQSESPADILTTAVAFAQWTTAPESTDLRTRLQAATSSERMEIVKRELEEYRVDNLAPDEMERLYSALLEIASSRYKELSTELSSRIGETRANEMQRRMLAAFQMRESKEPVASDEMAPHAMLRLIAGISPRRGSRGGQDLQRFEKVIAEHALNPESQEFLNNIFDPYEREQRLRDWIKSTVFKSSPLEYKRRDPKAHYLSSDADVRENIDLMDPQEYFGKNRSWLRGPGDFFGFGFRPPEGPGDRGPGDRRPGSGPPKLPGRFSEDGRYGREGPPKGPSRNN